MIFVRLSQKETWGVLMRDDHPLAKRAFIVPEEITDYPLILPSREKVRAEILHWLKCEEKDLRVPLSYTLLSNAVLLVEEGLGCAFCLDGALAIHSSPHLCFCACPSGAYDTKCIGMEKEAFVFSGSFIVYTGN